MFKLFSLIALGCLLFVSLVGKSEPVGNCGPHIISNAPKCVARHVFDGKDKYMPEGNRYQIAVDPVRDVSGRIVIPDTISGAFVLMQKMLPRWYLNALYMSHGDNECDVIVNGFSYATLVGAWIRVNWNLDDIKSPLIVQFTRIGIIHNDGIDQAITFGFCEYVKNGEQKAMQVIMKRAAWERVNKKGADKGGGGN